MKNKTNSIDWYHGYRSIDPSSIVPSYAQSETNSDKNSVLQLESSTLKKIRTFSTTFLFLLFC
jgi:hypothetical protein